MIHMRRWVTAVWTASGDLERPARHGLLGCREMPHVAGSEYIDRCGAWAALVYQTRPDGRTGVPTIIAHVATDAGTGDTGHIVNSGK